MAEDRLSSGVFNFFALHIVDQNCEVVSNYTPGATQSLHKILKCLTCRGCNKTYFIKGF